MTSPNRALQSVAMLMAVSACSSAPKPTPNAAAPSAAPTTACTAVALRADASGWTTITARGFSLCVPVDWQGGGDSRRKGRTSVSWGRGNPPRTRVAYTTRVVMRAGERPPAPELPPGTESRQFTEQIGGSTANMWRSRFDNTYFVGAHWRDKSVWVSGESPDSDAADIMLIIARTVRFVE